MRDTEQVDTVGVPKVGGAADADSDAKRDLIVIGASAGGVEALKYLVADLPADLPAVVVAVLHLMSSGPSRLDTILDRVSQMPVTLAADGERPERGHVYIAPPGFHTLLQGDSIQLSDAPPENGYRPSIDQFFLSAARAYGRRAIGVVLTGTLSDGTEGLRLIKAHGGATVVQDPDDAIFDDMPRNAIDQVEPDRIAPLEGLGGVLCELLGVPHPKGQTANSAVLGPSRKPLQPGAVLLTCPTCGGVLIEHADEEVFKLTCQAGHTYTPEDLAEKQHADLEAALWQAVRMFKERTELLRLMAARIPRKTAYMEHATLNERAATAAAHAVEIRGMILRLQDTAGRVTTEANK